MDPVVDIFIKTHKADAAYHAACMASIRKFATGFRDTIVVEGEHPQGYIHQQVIKLHANEHSDADYFLMTDSDTLFDKPVVPQDFFVNGKPVWIITPYNAELRAHEGLMQWHRVMTEFAGVEPEFEHMRRQPFLVPRWLLESLQAECWKRHGRTMKEYPFDKGVMSEFNLLGHHAWLHHRDKFHWINTDVDPLPEPTVKQYWSHDPIEKNMESIMQILVP